MQFRTGSWLAAAALALSACAMLQPVETGQKMIGSPESAVRDAFGKPTETYPLHDGTSRWIYSKQPLGFEVYAADFDAAGKLTNFRQMLTEEEIYTARPGVWTKRDVAERFGMPREPVQYYPLMKREAWSYRLYVAGYQPAHFSAYFDDRGVLDRTMIIVDPLGGDDRSSSK
ncbi:hypothetical protein LMG23992_04833 [Cupriavidus laharis]|uniref:Transmembrane protein n=1 Tax=Cupriavidus laharis TaxID=151654 RepID=A0ABN7ZA40_9BURK|nr:hypothetical protein [Cupriavidus laharis]CAG9182814.1 hypothetical protein LMG23992_04833 [Cupriavidus laharis]